MNPKSITRNASVVSVFVGAGEDKMEVEAGKEKGPKKKRKID